jgi:hypothetical protein
VSAVAEGRRGRPAALLGAAAPVAVGVVAFALARSVLLPGQGFWDTGEFQTVPPLLGTAHPTGYPSYVILGWLASLALAPLGEAAFRMNLLSALLFACAAGLTVVLVRQLTGRTSVAVGAGLLLALTPIPWRMGTFADPHTLHLALLAALLVLLVGWEHRARAGASGADRWLVASAALYGVMLGNHTLTVLLAPGIGLYVLAVAPRILARPRLVAGCAAVLLATTLALYLELPIRAAMGAPLVYGRPDTAAGLLYVVFAEQFRGDLVDPFGDLARKTADVVSLAGRQLGPLAAVVPAALVLVAIRRPRFALLTATWLVVTAWFAASYTNAAIDRYYLGPVLIAATWLGVAAGLVVDAVVGAAFGAEPLEVATADTKPEAEPGAGGEPGLEPGAGAGRWPGGPQGAGPVPDAPVAGAPRAGERAGAAGAILGIVLAAVLVLPAALAAPATAARIDLAHETRATDWSRWALATVDDDAVVVSWWSYSTPLWYRTLVLGERPDVRILDDRDRLDEGLGSVDDVIRANLATRPVYLVRTPAELATLKTSWILEELVDPVGLQPLYRVVGPRPGGGAGGPAGSSGMLQAPTGTMPP